MNTGHVPQPYQIQMTDDFYRQSLLVPKKISKKLPEKWKNLRSTPRCGADIKRVKNGYRGFYRLRIGDYHVIYTVNDDPREVLLRHVKKRDGLCDRVLGVLKRLWSIHELLDVPRRVVGSSEDLLAAVDGSRTLESFLLVLDEKQKPLVASFQKRPNGPWLVKGGPGTGKSTVALYCIRSLLRPDSPTSSIGREPLRILFTTFTKSLVAVSAHLLKALECDASGIEIVNVDELAWFHRAPDWASRTFGSDGQWESIAKAAIDQCCSKHTPFAFGERDSKFLFDEVNQVILGNRITSLEEYKGFSRVGRGRRLGRKQREQVWAFFEVVDREANRLRRGLPGHVFGSALERARPIYDYVFIDEAQDLLPVAIRMCVALAKDKRNVFLTADKNQSIYTSGFSWKNVEDSLDFRGRTRILRRNYRTTREIMNGLRPLLRDDEETDEETRFSEYLRRGPLPELRWGSKASEGQIAGQWVKDICQEENLGHGNVAVLCPKNRDCLRLAQELQCLGLRASAMRRGGVDLSFDGIKVLTMHNAKGLEFPIVAVVGLARGRMPWTDPTDLAQRGETDKLRRTFFVACSRAMRRLLVVADQDSPSPFVSDFDRKYWRCPSDRSVISIASRIGTASRLRACGTRRYRANGRHKRVGAVRRARKRSGRRNFRNFPERPAPRSS